MRSPLFLLLIRFAFASPLFSGREGPNFHSTNERLVPESPEFWYKIVISMALVLAGGVFAGYVSLAIHGEEEKEINIGSIKVDSWPYGA